MKKFLPEETKPNIKGKPQREVNMTMRKALK